MVELCGDGCMQSDLNPSDINEVFLGSLHVLPDTGHSDFKRIIVLLPFHSIHIPHSSMTQQREEQHTSLDSLRDKLLKYHDQVIERKINDRKNEHDALHKRLDNYGAHISDRIHRERQKKRKDEEETRMRTEEACRKRELLKRIEQEEISNSELLAENDHLQKVEEMMRKYGTIEARRTTHTEPPPPRGDDHDRSDNSQVFFLSRRR